MGIKKLFVSRILLNPRSQKVQDDLSNLIDLHQSLLRAFSNNSSCECTSMLYRIEGSINPFSEGIPILVQSNNYPNWIELEKGGYIFMNPIIKEINNIDIRKNFSYRFLLRANPARRSQENTKIVGLHNTVELIQWINKKGLKHGFIVDENELVIRKLPPLIAFMNEEGDKEKLEINCIEHSGILQATRINDLTQALYTGIGRGKDFGCGLLSLAT